MHMPAARYSLRVGKVKLSYSSHSDHNYKASQSVCYSFPGVLWSWIMYLANWEVPGMCLKNRNGGGRGAGH